MMTPSQRTEQGPSTQSLFGFSQRQPLSVLSSMDDVLETPVNEGRLNRLRRHTEDISVESFGDSTTPPPAQLNAFQLLGKKPRSPKLKKKLDKSEFVHGEAEESDEDEGFGFGAGPKEDDEEDGEDQDKALEGLVDDKEMNADELAEEKVLEKVKYVNYMGACVDNF